MCLAVPAQIVRMNSPVEALCDFGGVKKAVDVSARNARASRPGGEPHGRIQN